MTLRIGDEAPDFKAETTDGPVQFHNYVGNSWAILFSHPKDFTPVCTTELGAVGRLRDEFDKRDTKVIGLSVDSLDCHEDWLEDITGTQNVAVTFPIIADPDGMIARLYGMIHPNEASTVTVRTLFVIGPDKKVKLTMAYPQSTGRNFTEILRVLDALQLSARHPVVTPANWQDGQDVIIAPTLPDEQARTAFPSGWEAPTPYLRIVSQPTP